ncbi:hypothetical protein BDP27DRAFT_1361642 [Rhodocollybia butyracea]|uniref:Uncharacterized protein n=1 Tax=Rhodocollybia butyracea TaxID=206335 RepID=A0A9P5UA69_9AGAR|nr:hypothetical protein BDP27DRAFT_1361642 [Rhodocollybia butyracea]
MCLLKTHKYNPDERYGEGAPLVVSSHDRARCSFDKFGGAVRCNVTIPTFDHEYLSIAWLAQAGYVLHHLNLKHHVERYVLACFTTQDYYLFLEPIKITKVDGVSHFSLHDPAFFWSSDPSAIKEETRILLGLSSLVPHVWQNQGWQMWTFNQDMYHTVSEYLKLKGFDPFGLDYARSCGYPIFKISDNVLDELDSGPNEHTQFRSSTIHPDTGSDSDSADSVIYEDSGNSEQFLGNLQLHGQNKSSNPGQVSHLLTQAPLFARRN